MLSNPYFQRKITGDSLTSSRYFSIRCFSSALEDTTIPLRSVFVTLAKKDSTRFSQDPCFGVKINSNRFGSLAKYARVSFEI